MTTFTVWKFEDPDGAARAENALKGGADDGLVTIVDHAVMTWPEGADKPSLDHGHDSTKRGAGWGGTVGHPRRRTVRGPGRGRGARRWDRRSLKATEGTGISKEDLERIRTQLGPGSSALFLVTENADLDRLGERFHGRDSKLISTNLTDAERATLLETFGGG
jgi:uncharacterized membrane protein